MDFTARRVVLSEMVTYIKELKIEEIFYEVQNPCIEDVYDFLDHVLGWSILWKKNDDWLTSITECTML